MQQLIEQVWKGEWSIKSVSAWLEGTWSIKSVSAWMERDVVTKVSFSMDGKGRGQKSQFQHVRKRVW
jgi:hypothetical protein